MEFTTSDAGADVAGLRQEPRQRHLTLASASAAGTQADGSSTHPAISADGTIVAFSSTADNLVSATTSGGGDIYEKHLTTGAVTLVSRPPFSGVGGDGTSDNPTISSDGSIVAFDSTSDNLVSGDQNQVGDVFVANLTSHTMSLVSTDAVQDPANGVSYDAHITPDGTQVVFTSTASNLVANDTNGQPDVFLKNLSTGAIARVDTAADESQASDGATAGTISPAGDEIAFASDSDNVVTGDDNALSDVFVKTIASGSVQLVSSGTSANIGATGDSSLTNTTTQVSDDGRRRLHQLRREPRHGRHRPPAARPTSTQRTPVTGQDRPGQLGRTTRTQGDGNSPNPRSAATATGSSPSRAMPTTS